MHQSMDLPQPRVSTVQWHIPQYNPDPPPPTPLPQQPSKCPRNTAGSGPKTPSPATPADGACLTSCSTKGRIYSSGESTGAAAARRTGRGGAASAAALTGRIRRFRGRGAGAACGMISGRGRTGFPMRGVGLGLSIVSVVVVGGSMGGMGFRFGTGIAMARSIRRGSGMMLFMGRVVVLADGGTG